MKEFEMVEMTVDRLVVSMVLLWVAVKEGLMEYKLGC